MFLLEHEFIEQILTKDFICDTQLDNEARTGYRGQSLPFEVMFEKSHKL